MFFPEVRRTERKTIHQTNERLRRKSQQNTDTVTATCHDFTLPVPQRLAKKQHQNKGPRVCRSQRRF